MSALNGGCLCGKVKYKMNAEPISQGICYCRLCQRASGSESNAMMVVPAAGFDCERSGLSSFETDSARGAQVKRYFCSSCGTHVFAELSDIKEIITLRAATLDQTDFFKPQYMVWTQSAMPGSSLPTHLPSFPGPAPLDVLLAKKV